MSLLPPELLAVIVEFSDTTDLPALALTTKTLHCLAEKRLYRSIILSGQIKKAERALLSIVTINQRRHEYVRTFVMDLTCCHNSQSHLGLFQLIECALKCATKITFVWLIHMPPIPQFPSLAPPYLRAIRARGSLLKNVVPNRRVVFAVFEYSMSYNDDREGNEYLDVMRKLNDSEGPLRALSIVFDKARDTVIAPPFDPPGPFSAFFLHTEFVMPYVTALDLFMGYYWTNSQELFEICRALHRFPQLKILQVTVHGGMLRALRPQLLDLVETWFHNYRTLTCVILREFLDEDDLGQQHEAVNQVAVVFVPDEGTLAEQQGRMAVESAWNAEFLDLNEQARLVLSAGVESRYSSSVCGWGFGGERDQSLRE